MTKTPDLTSRNPASADTLLPERSQRSNGTADLSSVERRMMLEEIGHLALTLGRISQSTSGDIPANLTRLRTISSPYERLHLLDTLWQELQTPLQAVLEAPDIRPTRAERSLPLARLPGSRHATQKIARDPRIASTWQLRHPTLHDQLMVPVPTASTTQNTFPNRMVTSLLRDMSREAEAIATLTRFCSDTAPEGMAAEMAESMAQAIRVRLAHPLLSACPPLAPHEHPAAIQSDNLIRCTPPYRAIGRIYTRLRSSLDFDWTHSPPMMLPALAPWHLYEIWCFLQVAVALQEIGWELTDGGEILRPSPTGLRLTMATGQTSRLRFYRTDQSSTTQSGSQSASNRLATGERHSDSKLELSYQPLFLSANRSYEGSDDVAPKTVSDTILSPRLPAESGKCDNSLTGAEAKRPSSRYREMFCSRSHAMQPDMAIVYKGRLVLLDPKFKRFAEAEETLEDIDKMHAYRDAISRRFVNNHPNNRPKNHSKNLEIGVRRDPPVMAAWCLYAGSEASAPVSSPPLYAYPHPTDLFPYGKAGIGGLLLRPGNPTSQARLKAFLKHHLEWIDTLGATDS